MLVRQSAVQGRPQETEASGLERLVKLVRQSLGNHSEECRLSLGPQGAMKGILTKRGRSLLLKASASNRELMGRMG